MDKKWNLGLLLFIGVCALYFLFTFLVFVTRGKRRMLVKRKVALGTLMLSLSVMLSTGGIAFSQASTLTPTSRPTATRTPTCYTQMPSRTPTPGVTPSSTATPTAVCYTMQPATTPPTPAPTPGPTITPMCYTMGPTVTLTPAPTPTPTVTSTATSVIARTAITPPFVKDGTGTFYWEATSLGNYINSWNLTLLEINGKNLTNKYVSASSLPAKIEGKYNINYKSSVPYGHFEAK